MTLQHPKQLSELDTILSSNAKVAVDFTASWCGPCKRIAPVYQELATQHTNIVFCKIDVDEAEDIAEKYSVSAMPTFVFFHNGTMVDTFKGASVDKLQASITTLASK